jgi:hypothetical protein
MGYVVLETHESQRQLRKGFWQYVEGIVTPEVDEREGNGNCMKRFWTYIKHKRSDRNTIPPLKADGILHPDSKDKAFSNLVTPSSVI